MNESQFIIPEKLQELLFRDYKRLFVVIGASDTGKSTFVEFLCHQLVNLYNTAIVDLDMGQSTIGPPTTIGWARCPKEFSKLSLLKEEALYFTGSVTPAGSLLPAITGARLITEKALNSCEKVIVDTTGLISEPAGRVLKQYKIEILRSDVIIAFQRDKELQHILEPFKNQKIDIFLFKPHSSVRPKTPEERAEYRYMKLHSYLGGAVLREFPIDRIGFLFAGQKLPIDNPSLKGRIVSLRNEFNEDMAIGLIESINTKEGRIFIKMPDIKDEPSTIVIGKAVMDRKERTVRNFIPLI